MRELRVGQYITVSVSDTDTGMSPEVVKGTFEPFFTPKDIGSGTGLGLPVVFGFAKQFDHQVRIYSNWARARQ